MQNLKEITHPTIDFEDVPDEVYKMPDSESGYGYGPGEDGDELG